MFQTQTAFPKSSQFLILSATAEKQHDTMKFNFFATITGSLALLLGFTSCDGESILGPQDCYTCTLSSGYSDTVCRSDFNNDAAFQQYLEDQRNRGYSCS